MNIAEGLRAKLSKILSLASERIDGDEAEEGDEDIVDIIRLAESAREDAVRLEGYFRTMKIMVEREPAFCIVEPNNENDTK